MNRRLHETLKIYGDSAAYMVRSTLVELAQCAQVLKEALEQQQQQTARLQIHQMIGISGIIGADTLTKELKTLQKLVHTDQFDMKAFDHVRYKMAQQETEVKGYLKSLPQKVLIYTQEEAISTVAHKKVQESTMISEVRVLHEIKNLIPCVTSHLPDMVIFITDTDSNEIADSLDQIHTSYLGTKTIITTSKSHNWLSQLVVKIEDA